MGGRGSASAKRNPYGKHNQFIYGDEFRSILYVDNIKFVKYTIAINEKIPLETQSASRKRVYVIVRDDGKLKSIATYSKDGLIDRQIDIDRDHGKGIPHLHLWVNGKRVDGQLSNADIKLYERVKNIWTQK